MEIGDIEKMGELASPLMKWLAENHHPHMKVIVDSTMCEMVEGVMTYHTLQFITD